MLTESNFVELAAVLSQSKYDKDAKPFFDLMSGGMLWSDETISGLSPELLGCLRALFRYRTSLIEGRPDTRFEALWARIKQLNPNWIGLRSERCTPSDHLKLLLQEVRK